MRASLLPALLLPVIASPLAAQTFTSACECTGCHGVYRWAAKTGTAAPPATIPPAHRLRPSDFALLAGPGGQFSVTTPRIAPELEWYAVTGRVTHVKAEPDGDLHVQLLDATAPAGTTNGYLVVEIPNGAPWCALRARVLGWTGVQWPLAVGKNGKVLALTKHPVVRVVGRAFYDAIHAPGGNTTLNSRPVVGGAGFTGAIWEIHPVMRLTVVSGG